MTMRMPSPLLLLLLWTPLDLQGQTQPTTSRSGIETKFRVVDRQGKAWAGATVVAWSKPVGGTLERVEERSGKKGYASLELLPGRIYSAWAWSPVPGSECGEYRVSALALRVGSGGFFKLREESRTRLRLRIDLQNLDSWKRPLKASLHGFLDIQDERYLSLDVPIMEGQLTLPVSPLSGASLLITDADGHRIALREFQLGRTAHERSFPPTDPERKDQANAATVDPGHNGLRLLELGKLEWDLPDPYHFKVHIAESATRKPIANARVFQTIFDATYELGQSDSQGMAILTQSMASITRGVRQKQAGGRPPRSQINFSVQARGYPETQIMRTNLALPEFKERKEIERKECEPLLLARLDKGFVVKGRVSLTKGKPLKRATLIVRAGSVWDYGKNRQGFSQSGRSHPITTDDQGRFEWPYGDERVRLSIGAILDPQPLSKVQGESGFPTSARILLYSRPGESKGGWGLVGLGKIVKNLQAKGTSRDLGELRIDELSSITVRAMQTDGEPAAHARISIISQKNDPPEISSALHLCNHLGRVRILIPASGRHFIGAGFESQTLFIPFSLPIATPIRMRLVTSPMLRGKIVDDQGHPIEGAHVFAHPQAAQKVLHLGLWNAIRGQGIIRSAQDGRFEIPVTRNSTWSLTALYRLADNGWRPAPQQIVEIGDSPHGPKDIVITAPDTK